MLLNNLYFSKIKYFHDFIIAFYEQSFLEPITNIYQFSGSGLDHSCMEFFDWFSKYKFLGISLASLAKCMGFLVAGFVLGRLLRYPIVRWLERITPEKDHTTSKRVGRSIEEAVFLLVFTLVLKSGPIDVLYLPSWAWEKAQNASCFYHYCRGLGYSG